MPSTLSITLPLAPKPELLEYPRIKLESGQLAQRIENSISRDEFLFLFHVDGMISILPADLLKQAFMTISAEEEEDDGEDS